MQKDHNKKQSLLFLESEMRSEVLDFTSISVFQRCPLEYRYRYLPRDRGFDPPGTGIEIYLGRILHSITSDYLKRKKILGSENISLQEYLERFEMHLRNLDGICYKNVMTAIDHLIKGPLSQLIVHAIEYPFKNPFKGFLLIGRIDCVGRDTQGDLIVDFKLDQAELDHHSSQSSRYLQLVFYYLGIRDSISLKSPHLAYYFFSNGSFERVEVSEKLIWNGWEEIQRLNEERKTISTFPSRKTYYCSSCAVKNRGFCPLW